MQNANFSRQSDFHTAALYGDTTTLVKEIEKGVNVKSLNDYKRSALHNAAIGGQLAVVQILLVDPFVVDQINWPDVDGNTCVHLAAIHGQTNVLSVFIDNGADFHRANNNGLFPVHLAAKRGHWQILKLMHDSQIRLDLKCLEFERTAIHYAAEAGAEEVVRGLVTQNAVDMADADINGNLTTHMAAMGNQLKVLRYLVEQGIHVDRIPNKLGRYPLHYAAAANATKVVHWILENSSPNHVNAQDTDGITPAHMAGLYGAAAAFNCLLTHGSDLALESREGETPMDVTRRAGHPVLIEKAANNEIECPQCKKTRDELNWRKSHPIPGVMQKIARDQLRIFRKKGKKDSLFRPLGEGTSSSTNNNNNSKPISRESVDRLSSAASNKRASSAAKGGVRTTNKEKQKDNETQLVAIGVDLPTKYYGEHIETQIYKLNLKDLS